MVMNKAMADKLDEGQKKLKQQENEEEMMEDDAESELIMKKMYNERIQ